ncbi:hypothetical protein LINGRAHAP2_LOCUS25351, partial [Linum grandiflorum]
PQISTDLSLILLSSPSIFFLFPFFICSSFSSVQLRRRQRRQPAVADCFLPPLLSISFLSRSLAQKRPEATTSLFSSTATAAIHPPRRHSSGDGGDGVTGTGALFLRPEQRAIECSINVGQPRVASTDDECSFP